MVVFLEEIPILIYPIDLFFILNDNFLYLFKEYLKYYIKCERTESKMYDVQKEDVHQK